MFLWIEILFLAYLQRSTSFIGRNIILTFKRFIFVTSEVLTEKERRVEFFVLKLK